MASGNPHEDTWSTVATVNQTHPYKSKRFTISPVTARYWKFTILETFDSSPPTISFIRFQRGGMTRSLQPVPYQHLPIERKACPPGLEIRSTDECWRALRQLQVLTMERWAGNHPDLAVPRWCSVRGPDSVPPFGHFNGNPDAVGGRNDLGPVCRTTAPTKADLAAKARASATPQPAMEPEATPSDAVAMGPFAAPPALSLPAFLCILRQRLIRRLGTEHQFAELAGSTFPSCQRFSVAKRPVAFGDCFGDCE